MDKSCYFLEIMQNAVTPFLCVYVSLCLSVHALEQHEFSALLSKAACSRADRCFRLQFYQQWMKFFIVPCSHQSLLCNLKIVADMLGVI